MTIMSTTIKKVKSRYVYVFFFNEYRTDFTDIIPLISIGNDYVQIRRLSDSRMIGIERSQNAADT